MTQFNASTIWTLFDASLKRAKLNLSKLKVFCGRKPNFAGLSGWVFEQTIQHCIKKELKVKRFAVEIAEQVSVGGRAKADLTVGKAAIEIKTSGLFGLSDVRRYRKYRKQFLYRIVSQVLKKNCIVRAYNLVFCKLILLPSVIIKFQVFGCVLKTQIVLLR